MELWQVVGLMLVAYVCGVVTMAMFAASRSDDEG